MKKTLTGCRIAAIAACLPAREIVLDEAFCGCSAAEIEKIAAITGITAVRYAAPGQTAGDLCEAAARQLLADNTLAAAEVDAIVFVSQSRDYLLPTTSSVLQARLGLTKEALAIDVPNGCAGYLHGLFVAHLLVASGAAANVLLLCGETNSRMIHPRDRSMTMIFGDAGSATLLRADAVAATCFNLKTDGSGFDKIIVPHGGHRYPLTAASLEATERENGNQRRDIDMFMDGMSVFNFAITEVPKSIAETLADHALAAADVDLYALHQANALILKQIAKKAKVPAERLPFLAGRVGNTGPASIPLALSTGFDGERAAGLRRALLCGFGVGLNWGTVLCDLSATAIGRPTILAS